MRSLKQFAILSALALLGFTACKKEPGPKGDNGPTGATGSTGATGAAGNLNMQVMTFTTSFSSWTAYNTPYNYDEAILNVAAITSSVVSNGDVNVYIKRVSDTTWIALPYPFLNSQYNFRYKTGKIFLEFTLINNGVPPVPTTQEYKVVVLPPGFKTNNPNFDVNSYNAVKQRFNLKD